MVHLNHHMVILLPCWFNVGRTYWLKTRNVQTLIYKSEFVLRDQTPVPYNAISDHEPPHTAPYI